MANVQIDVKAGDKFWMEGMEFRVLSVDCRENRSQVAIDRGIDASGDERRVEARRVHDGFKRRFSVSEMNALGYLSPRTRQRWNSRRAS
jgi:hypothetical protein